MAGEPPGIAPLGSSGFLYVGPLWCGWHGRGVAQQPVVWWVLMWESGGLGVVILVVLAEG